MKRGEYTFLLGDGEAFVDLHWAATQHDLFPHDLEILQQRLEPVSLAVGEDIWFSDTEAHVPWKTFKIR